MPSTVTSSKLAERIAVLQANPAAMQRMMLRTLEDITNGEVIIVDPTNPFIFLMEATCSIASAGMTQAEAITQKLYPKRAVSDEDLYRHMSDSDYLNRFDKPGKTAIHLLLDVEELKQKAVLIPDGSGIKQIVIPKHTEITVAGVKLTMQYPIQLRVMPHGGVGVFYDTSSYSPLYALESNKLPFVTGRVRGRPFIRFSIPVHEMSINSQLIQLNNATGFAKSFDFSNKFYFCRAYTKNTIDNKWVEIKTTHSEQVYDINEPTLVLQVLEGRLKASLPQIYFNNGLIKDSLRVDIYTTQGIDDFNLGGYDMTAYSANWLDYDSVDTSIYSSPLFTFSGLLMFSDQVISGASAGISFDALRDKVITNGLSNNNLPITNSQLVNVLSSQNYDVVTNLDNITNRQFLASRTLPIPKQIVQNDFNTGTTISAAGATVLTIQETFNQLKTYPFVTDNGNRLTILPETLFTRNNGQLKLVDTATHLNLIDLMATSPEGLATTINENLFVYTPFYYVLDANKDLFETRAYVLDRPEVISKFFVTENTGFGIPVSTKSYILNKNINARGYVLQITVETSDVFLELDIDQINIQLSFLPKGSLTRTVFNGVLVSPLDTNTNKPIDNIYTYEFYLDTNYDVDDTHSLILEPTGTSLSLTNEFDLVYVVKNHSPLGSTTSTIENFYVETELSNYDDNAIYRGLTHEKITLKFGEWLEHLWVRSRSAVSEETYLSYSEDVPAVYGEDVYLRDSIGNLVLDYDSGTNEITTTLLHQQGEPVLTVVGQTAFNAAKALNPLLTVMNWWSTLTNTQRKTYQVIARLKGEHILNAQGLPIAVSSMRDIYRQVDIVLLDGRYYFATEDATLSYRTELMSAVISWVNTELEELSLRLLEQSELYFYPKITMGEIEVIVGENDLQRIDAEQRLSVTFYMEEDKVNNDELKRNVIEKTARIISTQLEQSTISVAGMQNALIKEMGSDIISVTLKGFTDDTYDTITIVDTAKRPSIGKQIIALSNLTLAVRDAINISFLKHLKN